MVIIAVIASLLLGFVTTDFENYYYNISGNDGEIDVNK